MTRARATADEGFVLITAVILLLIIMTTGLAVLQFGDSQQNGARVERTREASFQLAETALSAQAFQLDRLWPGSATSAAPLECSATASAAAACPDPVAIAATHTGADYGAQSCNGVLAVPWRTTVRDDAGTSATGAISYYDRATVDARPTFDANRNGQVWVRSTGVARCKVQTVVALVSQKLVGLPFPRNTITANWFHTNNQGRKVIVNTLGSRAASPGKLAVRCKDLGPVPCLGYPDGKGQVSPPVVEENSPAPAQTVTPASMDSFRNQAKALGTYYATCPPSLTGELVFVEDMTGCGSYPGGNSEASPGVLVAARGPVTFGGNSIFYGVIYAANLTNLTTAVVETSGTAAIVGAIIVDGPGGVIAGASQENVVYDPRAFGLVKTSAGAGVVKNSWRVLPADK